MSFNEHIVVEDLLTQTTFDPGLILDVGYCIDLEYVYEIERSATTKTYQYKSAPIAPPDIVMVGGYVMSQHLVGNVEKLVEYYRSLPEYAKRFNQTYDSSYHYWIRPVLYSKGDKRVTFPWYDTLEETLRVLQTLESADAGWIFRDGDRGWELSIHADAEVFHFIQTDGEYSIEALVSADRMKISSMAK